MSKIAEINVQADRVLLRRIDTGSDETKGGIIIPDGSQELGDAAEVISVGPGAIVDGERVAMELAKGDTVLINRFAGTELTADGDTYLVVRESDVLAKVS
tara:strand:- start:213 stop:512 length:300 start_codon:yes stop_codon:yes gene_type:complete